MGVHSRLESMAGPVVCEGQWWQGLAGSDFAWLQALAGTRLTEVWPGAQRKGEQREAEPEEPENGTGFPRRNRPGSFGDPSSRSAALEERLRLVSVAFTSTSPVPACSHWSGACSSLMGLGLSAFIRNREGKFPRSGMACARPRACGDSSVAGTLAQEEQLFQYGGSLSTAAPELGL